MGTLTSDKVTAEGGSGFCFSNSIENNIQASSSNEENKSKE